MGGVDPRAGIADFVNAARAELGTDAQAEVPAKTEPKKPRKAPSPRSQPATSRPAPEPDPASRTGGRPQRPRRTPAPDLPGRERGNQREIGLNLSGRARTLLDEQESRGVGLTDAAVKALAAELPEILEELERARSQADAGPSNVFSMRRGDRRKKVKEARRASLLLTPDEARELSRQAQENQVSMSQLVTDAVERHYGGGREAAHVAD